MMPALPPSSAMPAARNHEANVMLEFMESRRLDGATANGNMRRRLAEMLTAPGSPALRLPRRFLKV